LHKVLLALFNSIGTYTGQKIASCLFAMGAALIAFVVGVILWILSPWWWPKIIKGVSKTIHWQVRKVFDWIRWCRTHIAELVGQSSGGQAGRRCHDDGHDHAASANFVTASNTSSVTAGHTARLIQCFLSIFATCSAAMRYGSV
jgi:hypothetical protein